MEDYKKRLRCLAVHDELLFGRLLADEGSPCPSSLDVKTATLVRLAATIAVDAAPSSFQHAVTLALAAGATNEEIVATLEAVTPVTGAARIVGCTPRIALALGYDVEDALVRYDT